MKRKISFLVILLLLFLGGNRLVFANDTIFYYTQMLDYVDVETVPKGEMIVGTSGKVQPLQTSVIAGLEYAYVYHVTDPSVLSIDEKGNWKALKEGQVTVTVHGQSGGSSPKFEEELDAHGIQRAENEPEPAYPFDNEYHITVIQPRSVPTYRLRHAKTGRYTYTPSTSQVARFQTWGWVNEGVAWMTDSRLGTPIYRAYNQKTNTYFFTKNETEQSSLVRQGWRGEGVAFFSTGQVPVYRLYHNGRHIYTKSADEKSLLIDRGYRYEGVAWYAQQ